jgi:hypothetical protein
MKYLDQIITDFRYTPEGYIARIDSIWWRVFEESDNIVAIIDFLSEADCNKYGVDIGHQVSRIKTTDSNYLPK